MSQLLDRLAHQTGVAGDFYVETVQKALRDGTLTPDTSVLVVCGGAYDRQVLMHCGLKNVTISNLDSRMTGNEFAPYAWAFEDAEGLTYPDGAFDFVIAHSGLHHCKSPHHALCEMYRVARVGVLVFEPYDGALSRLAVRLNLGQEYEVAAVFDNDMAFGGVKNTPIPNFVYRWTEAEVRKAVQSYSPIGRHRFAFYYATRVPWSRLRLLRSKLYVAAALVALPALKLLSIAYPKACNNFAFMVVKPRVPADLFPWLRAADEQITVNREWLTERYAKT
jgi:SAM-dependent methyltransferase